MIFKVGILYSRFKVLFNISNNIFNLFTYDFCLKLTPRFVKQRGFILKSYIL